MSSTAHDSQNTYRSTIERILFTTISRCFISKRIRLNINLSRAITSSCDGPLFKYTNTSQIFHNRSADRNYLIKQY